MQKIYSHRLGEHRGNKRLWLESKRFESTGFSAGAPIRVTIKKEFMEIVPVEEGERSISSRRNKPVLDINNKMLSEAFKGVERVKVVVKADSIQVVPLKEEKEQLRALAKKNKSSYTYFELFAGGGTLHSAFSEHFKSVGGLELEDKYLETSFEPNNPNDFTYCTSIEEADFSLIPKSVDVLLAGIPCTDYSLSGISKKGKEKSYESGVSGHLTFYVLEAIKTIRPVSVVIEEVPNYGASFSAAMLRSVLRDMGYNITETILDGEQLGAMSRRKRFCMVASMTEGFTFALQPDLPMMTVADILEVSLEEREWMDENDATIATMLRRVKEHEEKGNGFKMGAVSLSDTCVPTITRGYFKRRLTDPILRVGNKFSMFTKRELARLNGLSEDFILPDAKTTAGEVIGQGVLPVVFKKVASSLKQHLRNAA